MISLVNVHLTGGMIAAAAAGVCFALAGHGLMCFIASFLTHFHEANR